MPADSQMQTGNGGQKPPESDPQIHRPGAPPKDPLESAVAVEMLENMPSHLARGVVYILLLLALAGFLYCYFGKMDVVVQARGKLIPQGEAEVVQPALSGILTTLYVQEGERVEKGAVLADLDTARPKVEKKKRASQRAVMGRKIDCLETARDIMASVMAGDGVHVDETAVASLCSGAHVAAVVELKGARMTYDKAMMQVRQMYPGSLRSLASAVRNKEMGLANKENQRAAALRDLERTQSQYELFRTMFDQGLASKVKFLEEQKKFDEAAARVDETGVALDSARGQLEDARVKLETARANYATAERQARTRYNLALVKHNNALKAMNHKLAELKRNLADFDLESRLLQQQFGRHRILAPAAGRIAYVKLKTPGQIVKAGDTVFVINPAGRPLVAKIEIPNKGIGRIRPGMKVKIKLDAYPYQNYGVVAGKILRVAPDSSKREKQSVYEAAVSLDQPHVEKSGKRFPLFTGLTLNAEIVVERRRIIENFLDPIRKLKG